MSKWYLQALLLFFLLSNAAAQGVYRWVDENGVTHFGDSPRSPQAEVIEVKELSKTGSPSSAENVSETPLAPAEEKKQPEIIMYSTQWCGFCKKARNYFKQYDIQFTEYDVEKSTKGKRDYEKMKVKSVPQFVVDGKKIRVFSRS